MQPVTRELFTPMSTIALGELVGVMWEDKIQPTGVNIDRLSKVFFGHGGAFDMPTWPTTPPRRIPPW